MEILCLFSRFWYVDSFVEVEVSRFLHVFFGTHG